MLPLGIVSGPKAEKFDLDSHLFPFFEELKRLDEGVAAYDAHTVTYFNLEAFVCLVAGDTPAISKLFKLSDHTGTYPCRACKISSPPYLNRYLTKSGVNKGETGKNIRGYYPLSPPIKFPPQLSIDQRERISRLPSTRIMMISPYALMTITFMTAKQVWWIQTCTIRLISRVYHHLHSFRRYLFPPQFHLISCI